MQRAKLATDKLVLAENRGARKLMGIKPQEVEVRRRRMMAEVQNSQDLTVREAG